MKGKAIILTSLQKYSRPLSNQNPLRRELLWISPTHTLSRELNNSFINHVQRKKIDSGSAEEAFTSQCS